MVTETRLLKITPAGKNKRTNKQFLGDTFHFNDHQNKWHIYSENDNNLWPFSQKTLPLKTLKTN
jgi:hypothetical protein